MAQYLNKIVTDVLLQLDGEKCTLNASAGAIIKRNTSQLAKCGDFWFPVGLLSWRHVLRGNPPDGAKTIFDLKHSYGCASDETDDDDSGHCDPCDCFVDPLTILQFGESLRSSVEKLSLADNRVMLFLNRSMAFACLPIILLAGQSYGRAAKLSGRRCWVHVREYGADTSGSGGCITEYRCSLLRKVLRNLIGYSEYELVDDVELETAAGGGDAPPIVCLSVSHKSTDNSLASDGMPSTNNVICGVVRDGLKMSVMEADEYLRYAFVLLFQLVVLIL